MDTVAVSEEKAEVKAPEEKAPKAKDESAKKTRKPRTKKPKFTDAEVMEFMEWKKQQEADKSASVAETWVDPVRQAWKEESRMVKGIFRMHEPRGGSVKFPFKKYKWDPVRWYTMQDGESYEIPLSVARHLNENCQYAVHTRIMDAQGNPTIDRSGKKVSRMNFESTEFAFV